MLDRTVPPPSASASQHGGLNYALRRVIEAHLAWLSQRPEGVRADFSGATLSDAQLEGVNLSRAIFRGTSMIETVLIGADLTGAVIESSDLRQASLSHADLAGASLTNSDCSLCRLEGANLSETTLQSVSFRRSDLGSVSLLEARIRECDFRGAVLSDAGLHHTQRLRHVVRRRQHGRGSSLSRAHAALPLRRRRSPPMPTSGPRAWRAATCAAPRSAVRSSSVRSSLGAASAER